MQRFVSLLLTFIILTQLTSKNIILVNYEFNKKYYAEVLCECKDEVKLFCQGQCELLKELEADDEKQNQAKKSNVSYDFQNDVPPIHWEIYFSSFTFEVNFPLVENHIRKSHAPSLLKPPIC
jgi:hypothetical protein